MQRRSKAQANGTPSPAAAAAAKTRAHERKMREARREAGDVGSIALLGLLYVIQGIPLGLHASVPFILQSRTTYADQAVLALASWPFSLKLLWAPIVDGVYVRSFGRRKTWLVPVQTVVGVTMLCGAASMDTWLGSDGTTPHVKSLGLYFFALYFLMATQDIAVDGWALTMLSRKKVGYAGTCNSVGQTLGYFLSYVGFLILNDADVCNKYFRSAAAASPHGIVTLPGFLQFWGWVVLATTAGLAAFKREEEDDDDEGGGGGDVESNGANSSEDSDKGGLTAAYSQTWACVKLPAVQGLMAVLLTAKMQFSLVDGVQVLKMVEYGMPKEDMAMMATPMIAFSIAVPLIVQRWTSGPNSMQVYLYSIPMRMIGGLLSSALLLYVKQAYPAGAGVGAAPFAWYAAVWATACVNSFASGLQFVAMMSFFARIADPTIGGTYMTLLNTLSNLGYKWPASLVLALVEPLTARECRAPVAAAAAARRGGLFGLFRRAKPAAAAAATALAGISCGLGDFKPDSGGPTPCGDASGVCHTLVDGYLPLQVISVLVGLAWLAFFWQRIMTLAGLPLSAWRVTKRSS